jgi:hypothetical protein
MFALVTSAQKMNAQKHTQSQKKRMNLKTTSWKKPPDKIQVATPLNK